MSEEFIQRHFRKIRLLLYSNRTFYQTFCFEFFASGRFPFVWFVFKRPVPGCTLFFVIFFYFRRTFFLCLLFFLPEFFLYGSIIFFVDKLIERLVAHVN